MGVITASAQGHGSSTIYPAMMIGGAIVAVMAACGLLSRLQRIFTPRVVISILLLVSFTIAKPIVGLIFADNDHQLLALVFSIVCVLVMAVANNLLRGVWKTTVVIWAMILGSLMYYCFTGFPSQFLTDSVEPRLLNLPMEFDAGVVLAFVFCYVALLINEVGSVQSLGEMIDADDMPRRNKRGVGITGLMNVVAGTLGVIGPVDYSLSPGVVASTSCASRYTVLPAAAAMILLAFFPKPVSILLTIPLPVMGTVLLYLMATQIAAGLNMMQASKAVPTFKDGMILGIPIMFNIILSFAPQQAIDTIPALLRPIVGNGFVMGIIVILLLEHLLLKRESR
jgi:xanthine/uracil/vitamin C permease